MFVILLFMERFKRFEGYTFTLFLMLLALGRFVIDQFRYYTEITTFSTIGLTLTINQIIGLGIFFTSFILFIVLYLKSMKSKRNGLLDSENPHPLQKLPGKDT